MTHPQPLGKCPSTAKIYKNECLQSLDGYSILEHVFDAIEKGEIAMSDRLVPPTPGELLEEKFLKPMGISQYQLANEAGMPAQRTGQA